MKELPKKERIMRAILRTQTYLDTVILSPIVEQEVRDHLKFLRAQFELADDEIETEAKIWGMP